MNVKWVALLFFMISVSLLLAMLPGIIWPQYGSPNPLLLLITVIVLILTSLVIIPAFIKLIVTRRSSKKLELEMEEDAPDSLP